MAGGTTRYRQAYNAGNTGADLPEGLASMADEDPLIDQAHDAGRNNVPFEQWQADAGLGSPSPRSPLPPRGRPGRRGSSAKPDPIRRSARTSSGSTSSAGRAVSIGTTSLAGMFFGAIAFALGLSVVDYGASGPLLWFKAKFLNEPAPAAK